MANLHTRTRRPLHRAADTRLNSGVVFFLLLCLFVLPVNAFAENCLRKRRNANKNAKATAVLEVQSSNKSLEGPGNKTAAGAGSGQGGGAPAGDMDDGEESVSEAASGEAAVRTLGETIAEHSQAAHSSSKGDLFVRRSSATNNDTASPVRAKSACAAVGSKRGSARVAPAGLPPSVPKDASADPQTHTGQYTHHHALESANAQMAFREFRSIAMKSFRAGNIQELERSLSDVSRLGAVWCSVPVGGLVTCTAAARVVNVVAGTRLPRKCKDFARGAVRAHPHRPSLSCTTHQVSGCA